MTIEMVNEILTGTFTNASDREYWENKKAELERKANNARENAEYFKTMAVYDR